ncbi:MAG: pantoate--beta-alanine ligase [Clostridium sp.]
MEVLKTVEQAREYIKRCKSGNESIALVPTMGYLHDGHKSLMKKARKENEKVIVSIFVNPTQFGPNEDLESYPRDFQRDIKNCIECNVDAIFAPESEEMYLKNSSVYVNEELLSKGLCGQTRPSHFKGVCTVVTKLFNIITPDRAYFGEKDAQQLAIIRKMVKDLNFNVDIIGCPIIREEDGLAKSSRNKYLSHEERKAATILNKSLMVGKDLFNNGERSAKKILKVIKDNIQTEKVAKIDYVEIVDSENLNVVQGKIEKSILIAMAVYIGKTRLIDNITLK